MNLPRWNITARVLGLAALVLAFTITTDNGAHSLKLPASGSGLHGWLLRGSRGSSDTALAISGAARFSAHGSAGGEVAVGPAATVGSGAGRAVGAAVAEA